MRTKKTTVQGRAKKRVRKVTSHANKLIKKKISKELQKAVKNVSKIIDNTAKQSKTKCTKK